MKDTPALSIIIPTLNEAVNIVSLIECLNAQTNPPLFEIIVVDGGSQDATLANLEKKSVINQCDVRVITNEAGRAKQMNAGTRLARAPSLLFLHADTIIEDPFLLHQAHLEMQSSCQILGHDRVAGHFGLYFKRKDASHPQAYYFYEAKTRLNRQGCINGDQGMWISRAFFETLGGFDESLGFMEDARLSARVFQRGQWLTFSSSVYTSARRFEVEGLKARQTLNALLCAMDAVGMVEFFEQARLLYRSQCDTEQLDLRPFLSKLHQLTWAKGFRQGWVWWWRTGAYVAANAWQLAFALDCRNAFKQGVAVSEVSSPRLARYDRYLKAFIESVIGQFLTMLVTILWFYGRPLRGR